MKKKFIFALQLIGIFLMVLGLTYLVPNQISTTKLNEYLADQFEPNKNDASKYLPLIASYTDVAFSKEPLFELSLDDVTSKSSISITGFLISSVNLEKNVDAIYIFINGASYKGIDYNELSLTVEYDKVVRKDDKGSYNYFSPSVSINKSALRGFFATELVLQDDSIARITALKFGIMTSKNSIEHNFLSVSNNPEINDNFLFSTTLDDLNINLKNNNLSSLISDENNIPTEEEKELYQIDYIPFDRKVFNNYYKHGWLWYPLYFVIIAPFIYLGYVRPMIRLNDEKK